IIGGAIAFILNVPMRFVEGKLFPRRYGRKRNPLYRMRRVLSLLLTLALVIAALCVLLLMVVPEMARSFLTMRDRIPEFFNQLIVYVDSLAREYPEIFAEIQAFATDWSKADWKTIGETVWNFFANGNVLGSTFNVASTIIGSVANFTIGLVFAIYLLLQKEKLGGQFKRVLYSFAPENKADRFLEICQLSSDTFSSFISGQCLEACILGLMFFFSMSLLRMPYAMVISILIAVTALIPIFGAFIGCGVGIFLILIVSPLQALWFLILFLVLQQVEGNLVYPHVVGSSVGLPSIWVLMAVTLGASTMGVVGMIINIPLFSIVYTLLRETVRNRLRTRGIDRNKLR
ncbi:MAG: AI-2E family transporter, partial [Butyricicoccus pullicaecorum]|nr:AI-2E family transporter [Butyricicoccus pullicaecorum]